MHTTAETALQESQTYTRNNSRRLPPQHKLVYSQYTPQLNSTELCEPSIPFSLKLCTPKVTEDMRQTCIPRQIHGDLFPWRKLICHHCTDQLMCLQQAVTNPLTGHGATKVSNTQEVYSQDHHQHPTAPHTVNAGAVIPTEAG